LAEIDRLLVKNLLQLNVKYAYREISGGITFLGWRFFFGENGKIVQTVIGASQARMLERLKQFEI